MAIDEESPAYIPGPLDELVPGLRKRSERMPALPVHPRIVHARRDDGSYALVVSSFAPAANAKVWHAALTPLVEAALLVELSRPASELAEGPARVSAIELYAFSEPGFDPRPALFPFGLERAPLDAPEAKKALAYVRREAQLVDGAPGDEPAARFLARVAPSSHPARAALHEALLARAPRVAFGEQPGALARVAADVLAELGVKGVEPTRAGIEAFEAVVVSRDPGVVRWIEPLAFQALCDLIAVAAHTTWGMEVEWGVCEPDEETGLAPPPVIRVTRGTDSWIVPLGEHVLRWCIMPMQVGEDVPSLGAWAEHEFA